MKFKLWFTAVAIAGIMLCGCYESPGITYHDPGVYKGKEDPLLAKLRQPDRQQQLIERFKNVQTDR